MNEREQFKLVPIEPTEEQIQAGCVSQSTNEVSSYKDWAGTHSNEIVNKIRCWVASDYKAMLEAAPSQPAQEPVGFLDVEDFRNLDKFGSAHALIHMKDKEDDVGLFTTPPSEAARIKELEAEVVEYKNKRDVAVSSLELCQERFKSCSKALAQQCKYTKELEAKLAEWEKLKDSNTLHINLLRNFPAKLSKEQIIHLLGEHQAIAEKG